MPPASKQLDWKTGMCPTTEHGGIRHIPIARVSWSNSQKQINFLKGAYGCKIRTAITIGEDVFYSPYSL